MTRMPAAKLSQRSMALLVAILGHAISPAAPFGASAAAADDFSDAAAFLDGEWGGDGFALKVDAERAQANVDVQKPFEWQRFQMKAVTGEKLSFSIGAELYEARSDGDAIVLTSTEFRGERRLERTR